MPSPIAISPARGDGPIRSSVRIAHKLDGPRSSYSLPGLYPCGAYSKATWNWPRPRFLYTPTLFRDLRKIIHELGRVVEHDVLGGLAARGTGSTRERTEPATVSALPGNDPSRNNTD